jgi:hypothetical protein
VPQSKIFQSKEEQEAVMSEIRANPKSPKAQAALRFLEMRKDDIGAAITGVAPDQDMISRGRELIQGSKQARMAQRKADWRKE